MTIISSDNSRFVDIGNSDIWNSLYSTVKVNLSDQHSKIPLAIQFLENKSCSAKDATETARQFNLVRDMLAQFPPSCVCYDWQNLKKEAPWIHDVSPVVTSCANFYTTADGEDLLYEIVKILCYAGITNHDIALV